MTASGHHHLILAARDGNQSAFEQLVAAHNRAVAQIAMAECPCSADELQDLLQTVWVEAWKSLPRLRDPERFLPWLWSIARNRARTALTKRTRREAVEQPAPPADEDDAPDPLEAAPASIAEDPAACALGRDVTRAALDLLSPKERQAFFLRAIAEPPWEYDQIGEAMGTGPIGARVAYSRACKRLAAWWEEEFG